MTGNEQVYEVHVCITATGDTTVRVAAESPEEAIRLIDELGVEAFDSDWDEWLNLARFDVEVEDDPRPVTSEAEEAS